MSQYKVTVTGGDSNDITDGVIGVTFSDGRNSDALFADNEVLRVYMAALDLIKGMPSGSAISVKVTVP